MKSYKNLYPKLCSFSNLEKAFEKAKEGKSTLPYVLEFEKDFTNNLLLLKHELETLTYSPKPLTRFVIHDPKTRVIRKSIFRDRIVHHAIVNILEPIYEKVFIDDSYANRVGKGTVAALQRFDRFQRKVSRNGTLVKCARNNNMIRGYAFKADIKQFFDSVDQELLMHILRRKIKDRKVRELICSILKNFHDKEKGMPLGNMTSQFFANVYLNELDYFVKHTLKMKYYLRYVDDFVIIHESKETLQECKEKIENYLVSLKLELHQNKSKIFSMHSGIGLLGFRVFYYYKLLRKRNLAQFWKHLEDLEDQYTKEIISGTRLFICVQGWFSYAMWGNTYRLRKNIRKRIDKLIQENQEEMNKFSGDKYASQILVIEKTC